MVEIEASKISLKESLDNQMHGIFKAENYDRWLDKKEKDIRSIAVKRKRRRSEFKIRGSYLESTEVY